MRSLLFVPADSERKLEKAVSTAADCLILDLEDSVLPQAKQQAREQAADFLAHAVAQGPSPRVYVRVNGLDTGLTTADLDAVMPSRPHGILLPKCRNGASIQ